MPKIRKIIYGEKNVILVLLYSWKKYRRLSRSERFQELLLLHWANLPNSSTFFDPSCAIIILYSFRENDGSQKRKLHRCSSRRSPWLNEIAIPFGYKSTIRVIRKSIAKIGENLEIRGKFQRWWWNEFLSQLLQNRR